MREVVVVVVVVGGYYSRSLPDAARKLYGDWRGSARVEGIYRAEIPRWSSVA
jgi:hypothetical protein